MRWWRLLSGLFLGVCLVLAVWASGLVAPPEQVSRGIAAFAAVYPGPVGAATVDPLDCPSLRHTRIYLVCTSDCAGTHRLIAIRGLRALPLANLNRTPPEDLRTTRARLNTVIARERLRLDEEGVRSLVGCYLRIEGLEPARLLSEGGFAEVTEARAEGEDALRRLMERPDDGQPLSRIGAERAPGGWKAGFLYWDTEKTGAPVLRVTVDLARDGQVRAVKFVQVAAGEPPAAAGVP